jgi:hypothetical protein
MVSIALSSQGRGRKRLLNLHLDELLALLEKLRCLALLKVVTNLWLKGLGLFNQSAYMR